MVLILFIICFFILGLIIIKKSTKNKILKSFILVGLIGLIVIAIKKNEENAYEASLMIDYWEKSGMDTGLEDGERDGYENIHVRHYRSTDHLHEKQAAAFKRKYDEGYEIGWERGKNKRSSGYSNNQNISSSRKIHFSELEFRKGQKYAYKNGEAFSGTAWSSDEKSFSMTADGGVVIGAKAYHSNGRVAIDGDPVNKIRTHYDEYGNVMSEAEFKSKYPHIMQKVKAFSYEIKEVD